MGTDQGHRDAPCGCSLHLVNSTPWAAAALGWWSALYCC